MKTPIGRLDPAIRTVHVWGGGVAGLLMAHFLSARGFQIELYEKSNRLGGKVGTDNTPTGMAEWGPNAIYATEEIQDWLRTLGLNPLRANKGLKRWIWRDGLTLVRKRDILKKLVPKLMTRPPYLTPATTVAEFFRPLLKEQVEELVSPALQGIYGTTADKLTVLSIWPQLDGSETAYWKALKKIKGPRARSISFHKGMQEFIDALAKSITGKVHLNYTGEFELRPNTIVCTDAFNAAELLGRWTEGAEQLKAIPYLPISSTTLHSSVRVPWSEGGFGVLFPRPEGFKSLGCLFNHSIFPGRTRGKTRSSFTFIMNDVTWTARAITQDLSRLDCPGGDLFSRTTSYDRGLPLYNQVRWSAIRALHQSETRPKELVLFGNYVAGISLREMINAASSFASDLGVE